MRDAEPSLLSLSYRDLNSVVYKNKRKIGGVVLWESNYPACKRPGFDPQHWVGDF